MATISHCTGFLAKIEVLKNLLCISNDNGLMPTLSSVPWSLPKRPWIVRTESNVKRETRKRPDPPCVVCEGIGRVNCSHCRGRGRTNFKELAMLPKGEWPKCRCKSCGGSGLTYCARCLGTGEYRDSIGFHFLRLEAGTAEQRGLEKQPEIQQIIWYRGCSKAIAVNREMLYNRRTLWKSKPLEFWLGKCNNIVFSINSSGSQSGVT